MPPVNVESCEIDSQETTSPCTKVDEVEHAVSSNKAEAMSNFFI
jgi:hypothetical protein